MAGGVGSVTVGVGSGSEDSESRPDATSTPKIPTTIRTMVASAARGRRATRASGTLRPVGADTALTARKVVEAIPREVDLGIGRCYRSVPDVRSARRRASEARAVLLGGLVPATAEAPHQHWGRAPEPRGPRADARAAGSTGRARGRTRRGSPPPSPRRDDATRPRRRGTRGHGRRGARGHATARDTRIPDATPPTLRADRRPARTSPSRASANPPGRRTGVSLQASWRPAASRVIHRPVALAAAMTSPR